MKVEQTRWIAAQGWVPASPGQLKDAELVLVFGETSLLKLAEISEVIRRAYPEAIVTGCSTAGEIYGTEVREGTVTVTAMAFERGRVQGARRHIDKAADSFETGRILTKDLERENLSHLFVLSDGLNVNGSELVRGLSSGLEGQVPVTGGLSGDGARFQETLVLWDGKPERNSVAVVGLYGDSIHVNHGCLGGWDPFGPERLVTRSKDNVLFELDGRSALELYKTYLGEHAQGLPLTGLLFPLSVRLEGTHEPVVRTILGIDEAQQSMIFAGDVPVGSYARLMRANYDRLIDGAMGAARSCSNAADANPASLAILISCVGRKLILKQRVEEEVEAVREVLGQDTCLTGFYSYGEISPFTPAARCELHNQTMTITTISEQ